MSAYARDTRTGSASSTGRPASEHPHEATASAARDHHVPGPLVSVVIPFHDSERFLDESIASVIAQTHRTWELILVDDGSRDSSRTIAREHADRLPGRVICIAHPGGANRGVSAARNLGLRHARGEYIAFLDADDVWLPSKLAEQIALLERHRDAAMVHGRIQYWYSWTGRAEDAARDHEPDLGIRPGTTYPPPALLIELLGGPARAPLPSDALLRTALVRQLGGFDENRAFAVYEDRVFFVRVELVATTYVADRCWVRYRQHEASSSASIDRDRRRRRARGVYVQWLETYLSEHGYRDTALWHIARRKSFPHRHPVASWAVARLRGLRWRITATRHRREAVAGGRTRTPNEREA